MGPVPYGRPVGGARGALAGAAGDNGLEWSFACPACGMVVDSSAGVSFAFERVPDPLVLVALGGVAKTDCADGTDPSDGDDAAGAGSTLAVFISSVGEGSAGTPGLLGPHAANASVQPSRAAQDTDFDFDTTISCEDAGTADAGLELHGPRAARAPAPTRRG